MLSKMLLLFVTTIQTISPSAADTFFGQGRFIYSYSSSLASTYFYGTEISYRPQNYQTYSSGPNGNVRLAKMVYTQQYTYALAETLRDKMSIASSKGELMTWSETGQYYYYTDSDEKIDLGQYLSITIELYGEHGETIYHESKTSAVTEYSNCWLDIGTRNSSKYYCSDQFGDEGKWRDNSQQQTTDSNTWSNDGPGRTQGKRDNQGTTNIIVTEKDKNPNEAVVISKGGLAAAISIPMIIVIIIAVVVVWICLKRRASIHTGNPAHHLSSRHQDNKAGRVGPAFTQTSAALSHGIQSSHMTQDYEIPMQPQADNIYDTLGDYRPPPPTPLAPYIPSQQTMHYSSKPYCYVGPEQDQKPRKAPPPRPVLSAVDESDVYVGPKQMDPSSEFETQRYDDASIHGYDDASEAGEEDYDSNE